MVEISWNIGTEIWVTRMILMNNIYPTSQNSWQKAKTIRRSRIGPNSIMHRLWKDWDFFDVFLVSHPGRSFFYCKIFVWFYSMSSHFVLKSNHSFHQLRTWLGLSAGTNGPDGHGDAECHAQCTKSSNLAGSGGWLKSMAVVALVLVGIPTDDIWKNPHFQ